MKPARLARRFRNLFRRMLCRYTGHRVETWGWTGSCNWPTKGLRCKRCRIRETWNDFMNMRLSGHLSKKRQMGRLFFYKAVGWVVLMAVAFMAPSCPHWVGYTCGWLAFACLLIANKFTFGRWWP